MHTEKPKRYIFSRWRVPSFFMRMNQGVPFTEYPSPAFSPCSERLAPRSPPPEISPDYMTKCSLSLFFTPSTLIGCTIYLVLKNAILYHLLFMSFICPFSLTWDVWSSRKSFKTSTPEGFLRSVLGSS